MEVTLYWSLEGERRTFQGVEEVRTEWGAQNVITMFITDIGHIEEAGTGLTIEEVSQEGP